VNGRNVITGEHYRHFVECSSDGMVITDQTGLIVEWNAGMERITGFDRAKILGRFVWDVQFGFLPESVCHPQKRDWFREAYLRVLSSGVVPETMRLTEVVLTHRDGTLRAIQHSVFVMETETGRFLGVITRDVTEFKQAEEKLRRRERELTALLDGLPACVYFRDAHGVILMANQVYCSALGRSPEQVIGKTVYDLYPADLAPGFAASDVKVLELGEQLLEEEYDLPVGDQSNTYSTRKVPIKDDAGAVVGLVGVGFDVTERRRTERALQESEERYRLIVETAGEGIGMLDAYGRVTFVNSRLAEMLGYSVEEMIGQPVGVFLEESNHRAFAAQGYRRTEVARPWSDLRLKRKDGTYVWVIMNDTEIHDGDGKFLSSMAMFTDITARKQAELALRESQERYRRLVENVSEVVWSIDSNYRVNYVSPRVRDLLGIEPEEAIGRNAYDLIPPEEAKRVIAEVADHPELRSSDRNLAVKLNHRDGRSMEVEVTVSPRIGECGNVLGVQGTVRDVTERKHMQQALVDSEEKYRSLVERVNDVLWRLDPGMVFTYVSPQVQKLLGREPSEFLGKTPFDFMPLEEVARVEAILTGPFRTLEPTLAFEAMLLHADGHPVNVEASSVAVYLDDGEFAGYQGMLRDVTERRRMEEALREARDELERRVEERTAELATANRELQCEIAERTRVENEIARLNAELEERVVERTKQLEAANKEMEAFAYSVSHDLRVPLKSIDGFSQALLENYADQLDEKGQNYLQRVRVAATRMQDLTEALLLLSRLTRAELQVGRVDLSALAEGIAAELQRMEPDREVEFVIEPGLVERGDERLLSIALENLLANSWKFSSKHPRARIEFGLANRSFERQVYFVRDDGAGFDMNYSSKLFGAFQRLHTESEFEGTGIGLAIVQRIIRRHGGVIWAEAAVEKGATFFFSLPGTL
jgi:PAS domain S-box-containing protein